MSTPLQRSIAQLVLVTFTSLTLQPLQAAAQADLARSHALGAPNTPQSPGDQYAKLIDDIKTLAREGKGKAHEGQSTRDIAKALRARYGQLVALEARIDQDFAATGADLIGKNLPAEILERHRAAVQDYQTKQSEFKQTLKALEDADDRDDENTRAAAMRDLAAFMEQNQKSNTHTPAGPDNLPFGTPSGKVRPPVETEQGFKTGLFKTKPVHLAANGSLSGITLPATSLPAAPAADLAETEYIALTPAIRAQAAAC